MNSFKLPLPEPHQDGIWPVPQVPSTLPAHITEEEKALLLTVLERNVFRFLHVPEVGVMMVDEEVSLIFQEQGGPETCERAALAIERWLLETADFSRRHTLAFYAVRSWFRVVLTLEVEALIARAPHEVQRRVKLLRAGVGLNQRTAVTTIGE